MMERREFLSGAASVAAGQGQKATEMYGLIGKMLSQPGQREALSRILLASSDRMPGCLSYIVADDATDPNAIWITEVWDGVGSHAAALKLPAVQAAIAQARPLIAGFGERFETRPLGGMGLARERARYF